MLNRFILTMSLFVIIFGLVSCSKPVPIDLVAKIEKKLEDDEALNPNKIKLNLGFVTLFDSNENETEFLTRGSQECENKKERCIETESYSDLKIYDSVLNDNASDIKELSTISVLGLSGIKINDKIYDACKYFTVDNQIQSDLSGLICKVENHEKEQTSINVKTLKVLDKELVEELGKVADVESIELVVLNDYKSGRAEFFLGKDNYVSFNPKEISIFPPLFVKDISDKEKKTITSLNSWTVITYRQNPCKSCTESGGKVVCVRIKDDSCKTY